MGKLRVMNESGDTTVLWNSNMEEEVKIAEAQFKKSIKTGMIAYSVDKDGKQKEIKKFDPLAEEILLVPDQVGGPDPASEMAMGGAYAT